MLRVYYMQFAWFYADWFLICLSIADPVQTNSNDVYGVDAFTSWSHGHMLFLQRDQLMTLSEALYGAADTPDFHHLHGVDQIISIHFRQSVPKQSPPGSFNTDNYLARVKSFVDWLGEQVPTGSTHNRHKSIQQFYNVVKELPVWMGGDVTVNSSISAFSTVKIWYWVLGCIDSFLQYPRVPQCCARWRRQGHLASRIIATPRYSGCVSEHRPFWRDNRRGARAGYKNLAHTKLSWTLETRWQCLEKVIRLSPHEAIALREFSTNQVAR